MLWPWSTALWLISRPSRGTPGQQHPARAAGERLGERHELAPPAVDRAEVARERRGHGLRHGAPVAAEAREVELVQQRRVERGRLVALQAAHAFGRRGRRIERLELLGEQR